MKTYYSDFVNHCLRFYARHKDPKFKTDSEKKNWHSCDSVLKTYPDADREMLLSIYADGDTVPDCVFRLAKEKGIKQDYIWKLIGELERKIAKRRGLL